jgi:hypothetical protein
LIEIRLFDEDTGKEIVRKKERDTYTFFYNRSSSKGKDQRWKILAVFVVIAPCPYYRRQITPHAHPQQLLRVIKYNDNFVFINLASILAVNCLNLI